MKRAFTLLMIGYIILSAASCRQTPAVEWRPDPDAALNVYFFHLSDRCDACNAIEMNTKLVLHDYFKSQVEDGTIKFQSINIDSKENRAITEKYQISYTSLLLVRSDGTLTDFTSTGLNYAYMNPVKFQSLLKSEIDKNLE